MSISDIFIFFECPGCKRPRLQPEVRRTRIYYSLVSFFSIASRRSVIL
jgi:hypothetical protein